MKTFYIIHYSLRLLFLSGSLGKPDFLSCSFAFVSFSGNSTTLSYLSSEESIRTAGIFFSFISSIVFIVQILIYKKPNNKTALPFFYESIYISILSFTFFMRLINSSFVFDFGNGISGTGIFKNLHRGSHPSFGLNINSFSFGTVLITSSLCLL